MSVHKDSVDGLLSTCMLMGSMTVCPERFVPTDSWVLTERSKNLNWLCLQAGFGASCLSPLHIHLAAFGLPHSVKSARKNASTMTSIFNRDTLVLIRIWRALVRFIMTRRKEKSLLCPSSYFNHAYGTGEEQP